MSRICVVCGKSFYARPYDVSRRGKRYCSWSCYRAETSLRPALLEVPCASCGQTFRRTSAAVVRTDKSYCSKACASSGARKARQLRMCERCGSAFDPSVVSSGKKAWSNRQARFCSNDCRWGMTRDERDARRRTTCLECGGPIRRRSRLSQRYCSRACFSVSLRRDRMGLQLVMTSSYRGPGWTKLAASIRERDGQTCRNCYRRWQEGERRFPVDHMRPWREFGSVAEANQPTNLVTLCPVCHAWKTHVIERRATKGDRIALNCWRGAILAQDRAPLRSAFLRGAVVGATRLKGTAMP